MSFEIFKSLLKQFIIVNSVYTHTHTHLCFAAMLFRQIQFY